MSTPAIALLKQNRIAHEVVAYNHEIKGAAFAAQSVGFPLVQTIKTLVVALDNGSHALTLIPGDHRLSLKKIAAACGARKAALADSPTAERLTGYLVGGISPFGTKKRLPAVMHDGLQVHEAVMVNGGQRGLLIKRAPGDIALLLKARIAAIAVT